MSSDKPKERKQKSVRHVTSRYMQAAAKFSEQSSRETTVSKWSRERHGFQSSGTSSDDLSGYSKLSTSPNGQGMTSTPFTKGEFFPSFDESVVATKNKNLTVPQVKGKIAPVTATYVKKNIRKINLSDESVCLRAPVMAFKDEKRGDTFNEKLVDADLGILYSTYLQAAFLESEAKRAFKERSTKALKLLHNLTSLVLQNLDKVKGKQSLSNIVSTSIEAYNHIQKQEDIMKPVFEAFPTIDENYGNLAKAVNATKHKLIIKDVIVPEPGFEDEVVEALEIMKKFINAFFEKTPTSDDIIPASQHLNKWTDSAQLIADALRNNVNLLAEARKLYIMEATLALACDFL